MNKIQLGLIGAVMLCAGCSGSSSPAGTAVDRGPAQWTTLGTRAAPSAPETVIAPQAAATWSDYDPPAPYPKTAQQSLQYIAMPDGTRLAAYVTLPADANGQAIAGRFPTVLIQTAYNGGDAQFSSAIAALGGADPYIVEHGYAEVVVDVRGTGQSQGSWDAFGPDEQADYGHVVDWVLQQPWCNGTIGVYGVSYLGITAILTAAQDHPAVKAAFPIVPIGDGYRDIVFTGGQVNPTFIPTWLALVSVLSLTDPILLTSPQVGVPTVLQHLSSAVTTFQVPTLLRGVAGDPATAYDGDFWTVRSPLEVDGDIRVPTFVVGGLHDLFQRSEPMSYEAVKTHAPAKLLIGPWTHIQAGLGQGLPADGVPALNHIELRWFDQYLKGMDVGADRLPNVTQYVLGYGHYVTASDWPHPQAHALRLYLHADKSLSNQPPAADEAPNTVLQEPLNGLCSISTDQWTAGLVGLIPLPCFSNAELAETFDVKYETAPLDEDTYINGPIEADVWISTTAQDAGVSVRIDDVDPSGSATPLTNGIQTASLRAVDAARSRTLDGQRIQPWHPYTKTSVQPLTPGQVVEVPVEIFQTSALIAKGHRLRVAIGASDLPQGVPPLPTLLQSLAGVLSLHSDAAHPSSVVLPVVPASALQAPH
ncbi:MAG: CocE/NonD family hydrolase [Sinobacteraceae bacterium]|nr:CocE/NonD family hydrolase [Nevskiaceae bacterium]